jgi:hypothetical protein
MTIRRTANFSFVLLRRRTWFFGLFQALLVLGSVMTSAGPEDKT